MANHPLGKVNKSIYYRGLLVGVPWVESSWLTIEIVVDELTLDGSLFFAVKIINEQLTYTNARVSAFRPPLLCRAL